MPDKGVPPVVRFSGEVLGPEALKVERLV